MRLALHPRTLVAAMDEPAPDASRLRAFLLAVDKLGTGRWGYCKCYRVLDDAAKTLGSWSPALAETLADETKEWTDDWLTLWDELVWAVRNSPHLEGQGNFGDDETCASHPKFLECRLTELGQAEVARFKPD